MGLGRPICTPGIARFPWIRATLALLFTFVAHTVVPAARAQQTAVQLDPAQTRIDFTLTDVLHTVHGMFKLKSGTIQFDPSTGKAGGAIIVDATSGESGNAGRDRRMHREILESSKFTEIIFTPAQVKGALAPQGASKLEVSGQFQLHGQSHDATLSLDVQADGQGLLCTTHFNIPYVQWGLKNPSTFILRVSDMVAIDIHTVGHIAAP